MNQTPYAPNERLIQSDVNVKFEDLLDMDEITFRDWVMRMRKLVVDIWDEHGVPPRLGKSEDEIIDQFNKMTSYPVHEFTHGDELGVISDDVIINKSRLGSEADQWFPNMYKTRINYSEKDTGYSIYDLFANPKYEERMYKGCLRHFRRDSMYLHALSCQKVDEKTARIRVEDAMTFVRDFHKNPDIFRNCDFMLDQVKLSDGVNSGYNQVDSSKLLQLTPDQVQTLKDEGLLEYRHHSTFDISNMPNDRVYTVRLYRKGNRIFPKGFAAFRIGYIQPAVNFPPMTAKYLYERFTEHIKDQEVINIYDPSSGWGGRILGAMTCKDDRVIHYIGCDPNPDNYSDGDERSRYADLANFYNTKTYRGNSFFSRTNTYEVFRVGSEEIQNVKEFQEYKGELDLVFTSPPYFNREAYSEDENQSFKKYGSSYESWRDGFLRPTLETAVSWLKSDRYLLWNIADIKVGDKYLPLQQDSINILNSLGMHYCYDLKMAMEGMPGQNRLDENGKPSCKNYCKVNDRYLKYEPVLVFKKRI